MTIGVDFDNTIVSYDALFHRVAAEQGLIPASLPANKTAVRDRLRELGKEADWTRLQGEVYGGRMAEAEPYPGVWDFFRECQDRGFAIRIISHKTRYPFLGEPYDLHAAATSWLEQNGVFSESGCRMCRKDVFFELTKPEKIARIASCGCDGFIDDLPEIFLQADFPATTRFVLFDPAGAHPDWKKSPSARSWAELTNLLLSPSP
ncbi:MAG: haloacid dehalogenase-like hydrolase [Verrucomicrobiae bacterium]